MLLYAYELDVVCGVELPDFIPEENKFIIIWNLFLMCVLSFFVAFQFSIKKILRFNHRLTTYRFYLLNVSTIQAMLQN